MITREQSWAWAEGECVSRVKSSDGQVIETNADGRVFELQRQGGGRATSFVLVRELGQVEPSTPSIVEGVQPC